MPVTQAQLLTSIRARMNEATARNWTDAFFRTLINDAAKDIARKTETLEDIDDIAAVISPVTNQYSINADCLRVHMVEFKQTSDDRRQQLEYVDIRNMEAFGWANRSLAQAMPEYYTIWGSGVTLKLTVFPAPSVAGTFYAYYYRLPTVLATDGSAANSTVEIPEGWNDVALDYVEFRALRQDRDPRWREAKDIYDENLAQMYDNTRRWVDQPGLIVPNGIGSYLPRWLVEG